MDKDAGGVRKFGFRKGTDMYTFYVNKQEEINTLNEMLVGEAGCTKAERAKQYHIPLKIAEKCMGEKAPPKELVDFVNEAYEKGKKDLEKSLAFHNDFWHKNGNECCEKLHQLMEQKIPEFRVRLQALCDGISDWEGTNIAINAFQYLNKNMAWHAILIWETILALTFQRIRKKYPEKIYSDEIVWAVSEMTSCAIINTDFNVCWNIGYRSLAPHQDKVLEIYKNRKNFSEFLETMLDYFKDKGIHF
ncbi:MAG: hypothetical protein II942_00795 [Alphaproteobacteria bacterium]|nr:hypothetical protein [Alphaproteobacteria bacterium]